MNTPISKGMVVRRLNDDVLRSTNYTIIRIFTTRLTENSLRENGVGLASVVRIENHTIRDGIIVEKG